MAKDGAMPQKYKSLKELQEMDPLFDFDKAYTLYGRGGITLEMVFIEETKPQKLWYKIDGKEIFDERTKFQISYRGFCDKKSKQLSGFYTTKEKAESSIKRVIKKHSLYRKIKRGHILNFMNRDIEEEE